MRQIFRLNDFRIWLPVRTRPRAFWQQNPPEPVLIHWISYIKRERGVQNISVCTVSTYCEENERPHSHNPPFFSPHFCTDFCHVIVNFYVQMHFPPFFTLTIQLPANVCRADSRFAPSQWETALLCNDVSHWLGAGLESALYMYHLNHGCCWICLLVRFS